MPKRKRDDPEAKIDQIEDRAIRIKASRLKVKIDLGVKQLKDAVQLARGFERQKLSRRQKQAAGEPQTLLRLREEVIVVRQLDAAKTSQNYLFRQLIKFKRVRESPAFVKLYGDDPKPEGPKSAAEANVLGRLMKSNPVKEVLPDILQDIRKVLNVDGPAVKIQKVGSESDEAEHLGSASLAEQVGSPGADTLRNGIHEISLSAKTADGESDDEDDYAAYNDRLAASSDGSEDEGLDDEAENENRPSGHNNKDLSISPSLSMSDDESLSDKDIPPLTKKPSKPPERLAQTAFLPSLSMGGYYSGSESDDDDASDTDNHRRTPPLPVERKNRRGQRARQQIAEKKYGASAKHLLNRKAKDKKPSRNDGWDARKGAVGSGGDGDRRRAGFGNRGSERFSKATGANGDVVNGTRSRTGTAAKDTAMKKDGPLHPSWEAARLKKKTQSGGAAFAGKKITFD